MSNVNLHLNQGATIQFSTGPKKFLPVVFSRDVSEMMNYSPFIYAFEQKNIAITGEGTLDGQASKSVWMDWVKKAGADADRLTEMGDQEIPAAQRVMGEGHFIRPNFFEPVRCKDVLIEGIRIVDSPMWVLHPLYCTNVTVRGVSISSHGKNNDGCDPDLALSKNDEPHTDTGTLRFLEFLTNEFPKIIEMKGGDLNELFVEQSKRNTPFSEYYLMFALLQDRISETNLQRGMVVEWWREEYLAWFASRYERSVVEIHKRKYPWKSESDYPPAKQNMHELISKFGFDCFTKDMKGNGRTFLPGLFCLTWYAQTFDMEGKEQLKQQSETETLIPFELYLSSLHPLNSH